MFSKEREMWEFLLNEIEYVFAKFRSIPQPKITRFFELVVELRLLFAELESESSVPERKLE